VNVTAPGVPLETAAAFSPALGRLLSTVVSDGSLTANVRFFGTPRGPQGRVLVLVTGDHALRPGDLAPLAQIVTVTLEVLETETKAVVALAQGRGGGALTVDALVPRGSEALLAGALGDLAALPLTARIHTTTGEGPAFDVRGLSRLAPTVFGPTEGVLDIRVDVGGTLGRPEPRGYLEARFARLDVSAAGLVLEEDPPLTLRVEVAPDRVALQPLRIESGGTLELAFELTLPPQLAAKEMNLAGRVAMDGLRLRRTKSPAIDATVDGQVSLGGTLAAPAVVGALELRRTEIAPDIGGREVAEVEDPEDVEFVAPEVLVLGPEERGRSEPKAAVSALVLDLRVTLPFRGVHLANDMMDLYVSGDLELKTRAGAVTIEGLVTLDDGSVTLYGKEFVVAEESRVTFDGGATVNPLLAIAAHYDISDVDLGPIGLEADSDSRITVTVSGSAAAPKVELTSVPAMSEGDIVAILLFDTPVNREGDDSRVTGREVGQRTANMFVGIAMGGLTKALQDDLPIDVLQVEGGEQGLADARIKVGKRLTRDLLVVYEANLGAEIDENANTLRVQYEFTRHLQLETHFGDKGEGGVDLVLRWRW